MRLARWAKERWRRLRLAWYAARVVLREGRTPDYEEQMGKRLAEPPRKAWVIWELGDGRIEIAYNGTSGRDARIKYEEGIERPQVIGAKISIGDVTRGVWGTLTAHEKVS